MRDDGERELLHGGVHDGGNLRRDGLRFEWRL
jgi:hypothetical protein